MIDVVAPEKFASQVRAGKLRTVKPRAWVVYAVLWAAESMGRRYAKVDELMPDTGMSLRNCHRALADLRARKLIP